jgi:hypothetical protein
MTYQNYQPFANKRQPQPQSFNSLVQTVCDRLVVDIKMSGLDPMPLMLRRRSVQETAILSQSRLHAHRSMRSNSSSEDNRNGKSHEALEASQVTGQIIIFSSEKILTIVCTYLVGNTTISSRILQFVWSKYSSARWRCANYGAP